MPVTNELQILQEMAQILNLGYRNGQREGLI